MATLNLGCGPDTWGDVRVDMDFQTQTGIRSNLNLRADAQNLPFRDNVFSTCRCWHVLEHVKDPARVLSEIRRTCDSASIRFPVDDGYKREMLLALSGLNPKMILHTHRTRSRRAHLWIIHPKSLGLTGIMAGREFFGFLRSGRKARFFRFLRLPTLRVEWQIEW